MEDRPNQLISWRSIAGSSVPNEGSVRFTDAPADRGTEVQVELSYDPPAGKLGATLAWALGEDAQTQIEEDLLRFKQLLETGEISTGERSRATPRKRGRRNQQSGQQVTEPLPVG